MTGIHRLLVSTPIWFTAIILWIFTDGAIHLMRDQLEGLAYQTAFSAKYGDAGLMGSILIGATILQRTGTHVPKWLQNGWRQIEIFGICLLLGIAVSFLTNGMRSGQVGDIYHDVVIGPVILFLAITILPVIWYNARWYEAAFIVLAVIVWASLVVVDLKYERFNQRQWLVRHGFAIKGEIPKH